MLIYVNELKSTKKELLSYGACFMEIVDKDWLLLDFVYKKISVEHNHLHGTLILHIYIKESLLIHTGYLYFDAHGLNDLICMIFLFRCGSESSDFELKRPLKVLIFYV